MFLNKNQLKKSGGVWSTLTHFPCFGHILNLSINDGIKDISEILSNLRNLGRVIKSSSKKQQTFEETAKALKLNPLVLKRDTYIRWNSTYEMIERGLKMKRVIQFMSENDSEFKNCHIFENDWKNLDIICEYLKPFYETTKDLSTQKNSSICIVLPVFNALSHYMLSSKNSNIQKFEECIQKMYQKFSKYSMRLKDNISYFAVILDPRLNIKYLKEILENTELEKIRNSFVEELQMKYSKAKTNENNNEQDSDFFVAKNL